MTYNVPAVIKVQGSKEALLEAENSLWNKRASKILKIDEKINKAKSKIQQITPMYLNKLIGLYERKHTSQKDKMHILMELKKYYIGILI